MDRAEAIEALQALGIVAKRRVWNVGDTIFAGVGPHSSDGITFYDAVIHLYERDDGRWALTDIRGRGDDPVCDSLELAVKLASELLLEG